MLPAGAVSAPVFSFSQRRGEMNQDLFEHRLPALAASAKGRVDKANGGAQSAPVDPDRHLDDFLSLMHAQHDSARALYEVHKQALNAPDPKAAHAVYDQAHAAIADHFDELHGDKPDWSQSLRRDLDADRAVHAARLQAVAGPAKREAAKQQVGAVVTNYARMAAEGDADRFGDRARRTVLAGAAAGLYPPEEAKSRFDDFAGEVERFKREQVRNADATAPKQSAPVAKAVPETTKSLQAWADQLAERERKRMLDDPDVDGGDLSAEIKRYTDALVHASPESKPVLQHLTMLLFSKYHDNAATGQLSDFIDDFADSPLTPAQRRESLANSRFLDLYLNEAQLNQTLNTKNAFANLAMALGMSGAGRPRMPGRPNGKPGAMPVGARQGVAEQAPPPPKNAGSIETEPGPQTTAAAPGKPQSAEAPQAMPRQSPGKLAFDENDPASVDAYYSRPIKEMEGSKGHVNIKHVDKTKAWHQERLQKEPNIPASSSFSDQNTAQRVIHSALRQNHAEIVAWLKAGKAESRLRLYYQGKDVIGVSVLRDGSVVPRTNATIVLKNDGKGGFYSSTAFPAE
jgi:hypothetical protein